MSQMGAAGATTHSTTRLLRADMVRPARATGPAAAAVVAAAVAVLTLAGSGVLAVLLYRFEQALAEASRLFVPGGAHLGRYGGQQVVALVTWLVSWALLHWRWRNSQVSLTATAVVLVVCLVAGSILMWPPVVRALVPLAR